MKNEDLLKLKIDIRARNNIAYQEMALLLDKPEFLQMLPHLRKDFGIERLVSLNKFLDKAYREPLRSKERKKINFSKYKNAERLKSFAKANEIIVASGSLNKTMDIFSLIATEVNLVCLQFQRPPYFAGVVRQAIFCGAVNEDYFRPTSADIIEKDVVFSTSGYFQLPQAAIFISPTTTYEDLKRAFRYSRSLFKTDKKLSYYKPKVDTVTNIRRYRRWYWSRLKGKPYTKIAEKWVKSQLPKEVDITYLDVLKGVKAYKKLLAR